MADKKQKYTMTQKEAQTMVDSIVKWEKWKPAYEYDSFPPGECPLCELATKRKKAVVKKGGSSHQTICRSGAGCPVYRFTGEDLCGGTLYHMRIPALEKRKDTIKLGYKLLNKAGYEVKEV